MTNISNNGSYKPTTSTPTPAPTPTPAKETKTYHISRELDGKDNEGVVGELLTQGTQSLADANKYFAMLKYNTTGLLTENTQLIQDAAKLIAQKGSAEAAQILGEDDMYVAGDPGVGGKGNNYSWVDVKPKPGYYTMFKDGGDVGSKITVNAHVEEINPEGDTAFTEYGFVIQDDKGAKTQATLSGGQLTIVDANGQSRKLLPPNGVYVVGNPADPTAKFYYADVPGAGKDGAPEKRLMVEYYEKPTPASIDKMVAAGMTRAEAAALRTKTSFNYGFRVPDGVNTFASPEGVGSGTAQKVAANGVKTYYDSHYNEGPCTLMDVCYPPAPPPPPPPYKPVAANERALSWGDPHILDPDDPDLDKNRTTYDFHERGLFNILKDKGVQLNAKVSQGPRNTTINTEVGVVVGGRTIQAQADGSVRIGYKDPNIVGADITELKEGQTVLLDDGATVTRSNGTIVVQTKEYRMQFAFREIKSIPGMKYIDIDVRTKAGGVMQDNVAPTGILGELFDADDKAVTGLKNPLDTYKVGALVGKGASLPNKLPATGQPSYQIIDQLVKEVSKDGNYSAAELAQVANSARVKGSVYEPVLKALADVAKTNNKPVTSAILQKVAKQAGNDNFLTANEIKQNLPALAGWVKSTKPADPLPAKLPKTGNADYKVIDQLLKQVSADGNYSAAELAQVANSARVKGSVYEPVLKALADVAKTNNKPVTSAILQKVAKQAGNDNFLTANEIKQNLPALAGWVKSTKPADPLPANLPKTGNADYKVIDQLLKQVSADGNYSAAELAQVAGSARVKGSVYEPVLKALADVAKQYNKPVTSAILQKVAKQVGNDSVLTANEVKNQLATLAGWKKTTSPPPPAPGTSDQVSQLQKMMNQLLALFAQLFGGAK